MPIPPDGPPRRRRARTALRLLLGLMALGAGGAPAAATASPAAGWIRPVSGDVVRPFEFGADPFAAGLHRGADLAAPSGTAVRAACGGRVVFAGRTPGHGLTVSVRCGRWRVSYLPLASAAVRRGEIVPPRASIGRLAGGHGGLHVGVRREGDAFGYVDPAPRFGADPPPPVAVRIPRSGPRPRPAPRPLTAPLPRAAPLPLTAPLPRPALLPLTAPLPRPAPLPLAGERPAPAPGVAPWPVWAGLGLALTGAAGGTTLTRRRRHRVPRSTAREAPIA